jgi:hypothetical protein
MGFFDSLFGKSASPGHDIIQDVALTVEDLSGDGEREISYERLATCPDCKGRGDRDCSCDGSGQVEETHTITLKLGPSLMQQCPDLAVEGKAHLGMAELGDAGFKGGKTGNLYLEITVDMGEIEDDEHEQVFRSKIAAEYDMPTIDPSADAVSEAAIAAMDPDMAWRLHVCAVSMEDGVLTVAICDPTDSATMDELRTKLGDTIEFKVSTRDQIAHALMRDYPA